MKEFHLRPLHLLTGRGHHFVWRIDKHSPAFAQLSALDRVCASLQRLYAWEKLLMQKWVRLLLDWGW